MNRKQIFSRIFFRIISRWNQFNRNEEGGLPYISMVLLLGIMYLLIFALNVINDTYEKEISQHAADSVAYSTALWKARGMNQIATINHLMGELSAYNILYQSLGSGDSKQTSEEKELDDIHDELVRAFTLRNTGGPSLLGYDFSGLLVDIDVTTSRDMTKTHTNQGACYDAEMVTRMYITRALCDNAEARCYFESGFHAYEALVAKAYLCWTVHPVASYKAADNAAKLFTCENDANQFDAFAQILGNANMSSLKDMANTAKTNVVGEADILNDGIQELAEDISNINKVFKEDFGQFLNTTANNIDQISSSVTNITDEVSDIGNDVKDVISNVEEIVSDAKTATSNLQTDVKSFANSTLETINSTDSLEDLSKVKTRVDSSINKIVKTKRVIEERITTLKKDTVNNVNDSIASLRNLRNKLDTIQQNVTSIKNNIENYVDQLNNITNDVVNSIQDLSNTVSNTVLEMRNNITGMGHDMFFAGFRPDLVREIQKNVLYGKKCFRPEWASLQSLEKDSIVANETSGMGVYQTLKILSALADSIVSTGKQGVLNAAIRSTNDQLKDIYSAKKEDHYHFVVHSISVYPLESGTEVLPLVEDPARFQQVPEANPFDSSKKINYNGDNPLSTFVNGGYSSESVYSKDKFLSDREKILRGPLGSSPSGIYARIDAVNGDLKDASKMLKVIGSILKCYWKTRKLGKKMCQHATIINNTIENIKAFKGKANTIQEYRDKLLPDQEKFPIILSILETLDVPENTDNTTVFSPRRLNYFPRDQFDLYTFISSHNPSYQDTKFDTDNEINTEKRTQWTRAVNPMINSLRPGFRNYLKENYPLSNLSTYFMTWSYRYTIDESRDIRKDNIATMFVIRPEKMNSKGPLKNSTKVGEVWNNGSRKSNIEADDRFSVIVAVQLNEHKGITVFNHKGRVREGTVSFAQAVFYPRDGFHTTTSLPSESPKKTLYQPQTSWDTLQWQWNDNKILAMEWESEPDETQSPNTKFLLQDYDPNLYKIKNGKDATDKIEKMSSALYAPSWDAILAPMTSERIGALGDMPNINATIQRSAKNSSEHDQLMTH